MVTRAIAAAVLLVLPLLPARAEDPGTAAPPEGTIVVRKWLALDPVDARGRVPFNRNAPFQRYLLDRASPPPKAGEAVKGSLGEKAWRPVDAAEDGTVKDENGAWFYGTVEAKEDRVFLAHLDSGGALFVNGAGFVGDSYGAGYGPVPVALRKGTNHLFVAGPRGGAWGLQLEPWEEGRSPILEQDATIPDILDEASFDQFGSVRITNASTEWRDWKVPPSINVQRPGHPLPAPQYTLPVERLPRGIAPLWSGKAWVHLGSLRIAKRDGESIPFELQAWDLADKPLGPPVALRLEVRKPDEARRVTFLSAIDGTAQYYAVLPEAPSDLPKEKVGTVLALHGASVEALGHVRCYAPKPDFRYVAPTNRRPFGFDWQDWGREDAYEVLKHDLAASGLDPRRVCLTGHSMGGHGTWHLAATDPGRWVAIAPSAGWCSFDTYAGMARPETPLAALWRAFDGNSRTEDLIPALARIPTFILHGETDDNVPISEAKAMLERLTKAGGKPLHHFEPGAGHWWDGHPEPGTACVDWPGITDLFRTSPPIPATAPLDARAPMRGFKSVFSNGFVLVVGTKGTEEENREMLELARYHAGQWWYRANGNAPVMRDSDFLAYPQPWFERNVIFYGNAEVNAAWKFVPPDCPVVARRGEIRLGDRAWTGDGLGAVFAFPRRLGGAGSVGAFASTGPRGTRLGYGLLPFVSGVGYPDYTLFGTEFLAEGDGGVLAAGAFDAKGQLAPGGFVRDGGKGK